MTWAAEDAVRWLERDYDRYDAELEEFRKGSRKAADTIWCGAAVWARGGMIFRERLYQVLPSLPACATGQNLCSHGLVPHYILSLPWTEEDDEIWRQHGMFRDVWPELAEKTFGPEWQDLTPLYSSAPHQDKE